MRKKELYKLNDQLFSELESVKEEIEELKKENNRLLKQLEQSNEKTEIIDKEAEKNEPIKTLENKIINRPKISNETEYGGRIIGKVVVSATQFCQELSISNEKEDSKELVNLILGRTEVAKAEILKIVSSDQTFDVKKGLIDDEYVATIDYFHSVMAQR